MRSTICTPYAHPLPGHLHACQLAHEVLATRAAFFLGCGEVSFTRAWEIVEDCLSDLHAQPKQALQGSFGEQRRPFPPLAPRSAFYTAGRALWLSGKGCRCCPRKTCHACVSCAWRPEIPFSTFPTHQRRRPRHPPQLGPGPWHNTSCGRFACFVLVCLGAVLGLPLGRTVVGEGGGEVEDGVPPKSWALAMPSVAH